MSSPTDYGGRQGPYQYQPSLHNPFAAPPPPNVDDLGDQNFTSPISSTTRLAPGPYDQKNGISVQVILSN